MHTIQHLEELNEFYGEPVRGALLKEIDHLNDHYKKFVEAAPFLILATYGPKGIDCSPRGDPPGFVRIVDDKTILLPDRRGNNRIDSIRNIVTNPEVGLIFLIPGVGEAMRVSGKAEILVDDELNESFAIKGKPATSVIRIRIDKAYTQCQKALIRSKLWDPAAQIDRCKLPSIGEMAENHAKRHGIEFDGDAYDKGYAEHMKKTIY